MAYLRCTQCGSKALVAASQCPKCTHPFNLLDARGERAKLKRCRSCGIMHRADGQCHWCGDVPSRSLPRIDGSVMRSAAAVALMVTAVGGVWRYAPVLRDLAESVRVSGDGTRPAATASAMSGVAQAAGPTSASGSPSTESPSIAAPSAELPVPAGGGKPSTIAQADSAVLRTAEASTTTSTTTSATPSADAGAIRWIPAVARTWVNVRSDASRGGQVVGVIKPASRAMLGTDRAGWRQVRSPDVSGWVDPRLFEPDSARSRGDF